MFADDSTEFYNSRIRMVQDQIIKRNINNEKVIQAMIKVPRHLFVDTLFASRAYGDYPLPIGNNQTISQPFMVALMTDLMDLDNEQRVLEIGTGSGYQTAILAEIAGKVFSIERIPALAKKARNLLDQLGYYTVLIQVMDGSGGWSEKAPFDRILVTASSPQIPEPLVEQLVDGGKLVIPVGKGSVQNLKIIEKTGDKMKIEDYGGCKFVKLKGKFAWQE
ncbi:MAG: protein-L-isoaspartate O-methyltransferase [Candidatus Schekmanbacteria bacterium RBG_13_48_7]|uniref:Protein-L-isoaspartate O-methyltransferase n=1 Tax=Candidatus Schekmanbacteria bacterium RBG_13_48_7 TaxID=1817878 RepID=A0A1F7RTW7_9BACT|nr:MAG: protein-L-isoaspartate O-methyltransferase [Candidatus Schekmanbacteria bacterium RBG_13_48_7]